MLEFLVVVFVHMSLKVSDVGILFVGINGYFQVSVSKDFVTNDEKLHFSVIVVSLS